MRPRQAGIYSLWLRSIRVRASIATSVTMCLPVAFFLVARRTAPQDDLRILALSPLEGQLLAKLKTVFNTVPKIVPTGSFVAFGLVVCERAKDRTNTSETKSCKSR